MTINKTTFKKTLSMVLAILIAIMVMPDFDFEVKADWTENSTCALVQDAYRDTAYTVANSAATDEDMSSLYKALNLTTTVNYIGNAQSFTGTENSQSALKFTLPISSQKIASATLYLKVVDKVGNPTATVTLTDDNNWAQTNDASTSKYPTIDNGVALLTSKSVTASGWQEFSLSPDALDAKMNNGSPTDITLVVTGSTVLDNYFNFVADDDSSGYKAYLEIKYAPQVQSVSVPSNKTYKMGDTMNFAVTYDQNVTVTGNPQLPIILNTGGTVYANYLSGNGTQNLVFRYTVVAGYVDADGITVGSSLNLNSGSIKNSAGSIAELTLHNIAATTSVLVDAVAPIASSITKADLDPTNAKSVDFTVTFSKSVTGVDKGDFSLTTTGTPTGIISGVSGIGTTYTVTVSSITGHGTLCLDLKASGTGITDSAGNAISGGYSSGNPYTIDTIAPGTPSAPDLIDNSDTGVSNADNITSDITPTFEVNSLEPNSDVTFFVDGTSKVTTKADGMGKWSYTTGALTNGTYAITVKVTDPVGNTSAASTGLSITIDTIAPAAPIALNLSADADSGVSGDNITNNSTPTITGTAEANSTVTLYVDSSQIGKTTADGSGNWLITSSELAYGPHTITARETDIAGNEGVVSSQLQISIDTLVPSAPSAPDLYAASDTGSSSTDNITKNTTLSFTGTAEIDSTVTLYDTDGTTVLGTATAGGSGNWSITSSSLSDGAHTITVKATDIAGNTSFYSSSLSIIIDTKSPTISVGDISRTSDTTATVKFTPDKTGEYFYEVVTNGDSAPTITTTGMGTSCTASTEAAITLDSLTAGAKDIYIIVKDTAGNLSIVSKIDIPVYLAPTYLINAQSNVTLSALNVGYTAGTQQNKQITISKTGTGNLDNFSVELTSGDTASFVLGTIGIAGILNNTTTSTAFKIKAKDSLAKGTYTATIKVSADNMTDVTFTVTQTVSAQVTPPTPNPTSEPKTVKVIQAPDKIKNPELISVKPVGEAFSQSVEVKIKEDPAVEEAIKNALDDVIKEELKDTVVFPLDISLYIKGTDTKVQPADGTYVTITCPIPENLLANKDKIKVVCLIDGKLTVLETKVVEIDGVWCVQFNATHFSPYAMVVDTTNALSNTTPATTNPKTEGNNPVGIIAILSISTLGFVSKKRKFKVD